MHCSMPGSSVLQLSPGACSGSCPLSRWCNLTISSSATWFSFCLQSFPVSQLFASYGQIIEASALASVLPMNIQGWFPLELTILISLQPKGLSRVFSSTTLQKHQFLGAFFMVQFSHPYMTTGEKKNKQHSFDYMDLCWQSDVSAF